MSLKIKKLLIVIILSLKSYSYATSSCKDVFHSPQDTFKQLKILIQSLQQNDYYNFKKIQQIQDLFFKLKNSEFDNNIISTFIKDLLKQDSLRIRAGVAGLRYFNSKELLEQVEIQNFLSHKDPDVIIGALRTIVKLKLEDSEKSEIITQLIKLLSHEDPYVIIETLRTTQKFDLKDFMELILEFNRALMKFLSHKDPDVIIEALKTIQIFNLKDLPGLNTALINLLYYQHVYVIVEALKTIESFNLKNLKRLNTALINIVYREDFNFIKILFDKYY
ncbi:MAG: hypothetical protein GDA46_04740 [Bdellovibrionales bacterium]|nr:hypothetical protein [Bdellovibrionales bacterium]